MPRMRYWLLGALVLPFAPAACGGRVIEQDPAADSGGDAGTGGRAGAKATGTGGSGSSGGRSATGGGSSSTGGNSTGGGGSSTGGRSTTGGSGASPSTPTAGSSPDEPSDGGAPPDEPGPDGGGPDLDVDDAGMIDCLGPIAPTRAGYVPPPGCGAPETELHDYAADESDFDEWLVGEWLACTYPTAFYSMGEVGVEITSDAEWFKLYPDGQGGVYRSDLLYEHGFVEVLDDGDYIQLNFNTAGDTTHIFVPQLAAVPLKVRLGLGFPGEYVRNDARGRCFIPGEPPDGEYSAPASCGDESELTTFPQDKTTKEALVGRWASCSGASVFSTAEVGLEIGADGEFYKLYADENGELVRGVGFDHQGWWSLPENGYVQLDLRIAGSGTNGVAVSFGENPRRLHIEAYDGPIDFDYVGP
jgi:hypothetical protein